MGDVERSVAKVEGGGQCFDPLGKPLGNGLREGRDGEVIGLVGLELKVLAVGEKITLKGREGKAFFGLVVVESGRERRVGLAHLVEEPSVESDGVLGVEGTSLVRAEVEGDTDEFSGFIPGDRWHKVDVLINPLG